MSLSHLWRSGSVWLGLGVIFCAGTCPAADTPTVEFTLKFRPSQSDVEYEIPNAAAAKQCKVTVERYAKGSGWVVTGPAGQILRKFVDSDNDGIVEQWRYFRDGIEVYRDIDTDRNKNPDQMRWFNSAGTRWGIDKNEDTKVDSWISLSPEEASREVVKAIINKDARLLGTLILTQDDQSKLGIKGEVAASIQKNLANLSSQLDKLSSAKVFSSKAKWMQFQGTLPSMIPAEQIGGTEDIYVHQNAMTLVDHDGQTALVQLGTLVRVGDVWKLTRMPQPLEGNAVQIAEDALFLPDLATTATAAANTGTNSGAVSPKVQKLVEDLQALDKKTPAPTATKAIWSDFNTRRHAALAKLVEASETPEDREQWVKQIADGLAAGVQSDTVTNGLEQLKSMLTDAEKTAPQSSLVGYITYRYMTADYSVKLRKTPTEKSAEIQEQWLKQLEAFVTKFPKSEDAPEAMFQLGTTYEFANKLKEARTWYGKLAGELPSTPLGTRGAGALLRLDSKGQLFKLKGTTLTGAPFDIASLRDKGKVVVVIYWTTWSETLDKDLPQLRAYNELYRDRGLEIVGVNLDATKEEAQSWIVQHKVDWKQLFEPGGLESSPLALDYGLILVPTMFVLDQEGKVAYRAVAAEELKPVLADLFNEKSNTKEGDAKEESDKKE